MNQTKQVTFVLVHGAWHGGWCWKKLTPILRAAGHEVYAPTLTGLGERAHLLTPQVGLDTHVADIVALLEYEDLQDVILVGHSYGGMVIAGVAAQASERLAHLIYLDAFLPEAGKSVQDYAVIPPRRDDGWRIPSPGTPADFGVTDARDIAWMITRLGDQPYKTLTQPVQRAKEPTRTLVQTFILCTQAPFFAEAAERAQRQGFRYRELFSAGHDAMVTQPHELARILIDIL